MKTLFFLLFVLLVISLSIVANTTYSTAAFLSIFVLGSGVLVVVGKRASLIQ